MMVLAVLASGTSLYAQTDRRDVRRGNRDFRRENYKEADIDYRKALVKDSTSFAANYNLANTLYRQGDYTNAAASLKKIEAAAPASGHSADYYFNLGDVALANKDYKAAVEAFTASLLLRPDDMDAKENYVYARKMLENQEQNDGGGGNDQNQDKNNQDKNNQDEDRNQDGQDNNNQDQDNDRNQDGQDKDDPEDRNGDDQNDNGDPNRDQPQNQPRNDNGQGISPQAAQQMLQAIQAKEKETQDKVNKEKAALLQSRQREKNW